MDSEIDGLHRLENQEKASNEFGWGYTYTGNIPLENYEIVKRVALEKGDSDVVNAEKSLKSLINTRAKVMNAKADVQ